MSGATRNATMHAVVRDRCAALGLAVWRTSAAGMVVEEPQNAGLVGLWLRSAEVSRLLTRVAAEHAGSTEIDPQDVPEGMTVIPLPQLHRRRLAGYTLAVALRPSLLESEFFARVCVSGQLDVPATRRSLRSIATFDDPAVARVVQMVRWMAADLQELADHDESISGFSDQLTSAYETIDLLYTLGHSMNEPNEPAHFVRTALGRLLESMDYAWVAALFAEDGSVAPGVSGRFLHVGNPTMAPEALERACREYVQTLEGRAERTIGSDVPGFEPDGGPQVVAQPVLRSGRPAGHLLVGEKGGNDPQVSSYDTHLLEAASGYIGPFLENAALYATQERMFIGTLRALSSAIDAKDPYTCGHSERVAHLASCLAGSIGFNQEQRDRVHIAGLVHDIGKIGVPESILTKPGRLTDAEFDAIKRHPEIGHRILRDIPMLGDVLPGVMSHHERWDGRGYPHGLAAEGIPFIARLLGLADTFDAMSSTRSYRGAMPRQRVIDEIRKCRGAQFDPDLVEPFLALDFSQYDSMVARAAAQSPSLSVAA
ncbi:MAG: HD-GYP domain-containing protein [Phycisphaeraceae bacterium]|nr:HD-GYP domain-containing protein [Phycisphaeraceae bacterium]